MYKTCREFESKMPVIKSVYQKIPIANAEREKFVPVHAFLLVSKIQKTRVNEEITLHLMYFLSPQWNL